MRDEKAIEKKKEDILDMVRRMSQSEDGWDYMQDIAIAGSELVELEKQ